MAGQGCVQIPTLTRTNVVTSESIFTTTSVSTSTLPESLSTSVFSTCTQTNSSIPCVPTRTSSIFTLPGSTSLTTLQITGTSDIPITNLVTLFGTTCSSSTSSTTTPPSTTSNTSTSSTTTPDSTTTPITTPTLTPTVITSSSVLTTDGTTIVNIFTSTSTPASSASHNTGTSFSSSSTSTAPPTTTTHSQTAGGTLQTDISDHGSKKSSNVGPIVGGVLGGLIALVAVAFLTWKYVKKQSRFDDIFNPASQSKPHYQKAKIVKDPEPKPYTYGLVGQNTTNPIGMTPPSSPPPGQGTFNNIGHQGGNDIGQQSPGSNGIGQGPGSNGIGQGPGSNAIGQQGGNNIGYQPGNDVGLQPNQIPLQHIRNPSLTPLLAGVGFAAASGASAAASSRPSSADSSQPLGPLVTNATQGQGYPPPPQGVSSSSYPPALQNWSNTQGYAPQSGYSTSSGGTNAQGYGSGPSMAGPSSSSSNPLSQGGGSINSLGSGSTAYTSPSSWGGGPSASGSGSAYNPALPGMVPLIATSATRNSTSNSRVSQLQQYEDPFARTGSPVSIQEPRILQVTNAEPATDDAVYDPNVYYSGRVGAEALSAPVAGPSGSGNRASQVGAAARSSSGGAADGSGRPLSARAEKAGLVHLDGGLYQTPAPAPAPPAYTES